MNIAHIGWWHLETLMPLNLTTTYMINNLDDVEANRELEFGFDRQSLVATLEPSYNFVVPVKFGNEEGVELYILCCERPLFTRDVGVGLNF